MSSNNLIKPNLFLNFNRRIGQPWSRKVFGSGSYLGPEISSIRAYLEYLIPAAGNQTDSSKTLETISNSIYIDARRHNMSVSNYGHLDPVKFCVAAVYPALLALELRTAMATAMHYEFGNVYFGRQLCNALGYDFNSIISDYPNLASRYNRIVARINNLMIPEIGLFKKWLKHRVTVYKDDDADRYSLYVYRLGNIYEYDTNASSVNAGQLIFRPRSVFLGNNATSSIISAFTEIERLLSSYEGDEDMVNFATEAIKAGMNHLTLDSIPSTAEAFAKIELPITYELDDIFSLENASFVSPIEIRSSNGKGLVCWDIIEENDLFHVGVAYSDIGLTLKINGFLPVHRPMNSALDVNAGQTYNLEDRPIVTHARITSEEGLTALTRYIASIKRSTVPCPAFVATGLVRAQALKPDNTFTSLVQGSTVNFSQDEYYLLSVFNTEILGGMIYCTDANAQIASPIRFDIFPVMYNQLNDWGDGYTVADVCAYIALSQCGFKINHVFFWYDRIGTQLEVMFCSDYDYITSVTEDALSNFFQAKAWNYCQLDSASI